MELAIGVMNGIHTIYIEGQGGTLAHYDTSEEAERDMRLIQEGIDLVETRIQDKIRALEDERKAALLLLKRYSEDESPLYERISSIADRADRTDRMIILLRDLLG